MLGAVIVLKQVPELKLRLQIGQESLWIVDVLCSEGTNFSDRELVGVAVRGSGNVDRVREERGEDVGFFMER